MHKEKNLLLDKKFSLNVDSHLWKAAKLYGKTSTDPDQSTQVLSDQAMSILCTETMNLSDLLKKQEMLQCVTNAPEGSLYWP